MILNPEKNDTMSEQERIVSMILCVENELSEILETLKSGQTGPASIAIEKYIESLFRARKVIMEGNGGRGI